MNTINTINTYLKDILDPGSMSDIGLNGIQVENEGEIGKIAFAVDASIASIEKVIEEGCSLLVVHHGFYWGRMFPITGISRKRIKLLLDNNIGLIGYHLPLDTHPELGNNARMMQLVGAEDLKPFGYNKGVYSGFIGTSAPQTVQEVIKRLDFKDDSYTHLDFGPGKVEKIAVVSGSGGRYFYEACAKGADLYITGDPDHTIYHPAAENGIHILFGGHYQTETFGIRALQKRIEQEFAIPTCYIDIPTGL